MSDSLAHMRKTIRQTEDLRSIVHTMKALAAANIGQYEESVRALEDYYRTVTLGLSICLGGQKKTDLLPDLDGRQEDKIGVIVFGSDQGLVGQFNEKMTLFVAEKLKALPGPKEIWAVGERMYHRLEEQKLPVAGKYVVPGSIHAITTLVGQILLDNQLSPFYIFHNRPRSGAAYEQVCSRLLPLDQHWIAEMTKQPWITYRLPEVMGDPEPTTSALVGEYLFVSLFKACAESLAAENTSRLAAMQQAEKNIDERLEELGRSYHLIRQNTIDEELFDIISGFEMLL